MKSIVILIILMLNLLPYMNGDRLTIGTMAAYAQSEAMGSEEEDCNGDPDGSAYEDDCGDCVGGNTGAQPCEEDPERDCNGDPAGTAFIDDCGECVGGNTGKQPCELCTPSPECEGGGGGEEDCSGVPDGSAYWDDCGYCVGGMTGMEPCDGGGGGGTPDCNGDPGGEAYLDNCGICVGGNSGNYPCSGTDCNGDPDGYAYYDDCGNCVGGNTGESPCIGETDCQGIVNGEAFIDDCGQCVGGYTGLSPCTGQQDCYGTPGGSAYVDACGTCVGGYTGLTPCSGQQDCNGDPGGSAYIDVCGTCVGGNTGLTPCASYPDCNGTLGGTAYMDGCGICVGGTTGLQPCAPCPTKVEFKEKATQKYGFDDYTNATIPWKSVEHAKSDLLDIAITPAADFSTTYFKSVTTANLTVSPAQATAATFDFTVTAANLGASVKKSENEVQANCNSVDGPNINKLNVVSYNLVTKTVAVRLVHSAAHAGYAGYTSTDVSDADIIDYLNNKSYNQGLIKWTIARLPAMTVDFDSNSDGKIDVGTAVPFPTAEMATVISNCKDDTYDQNIFLVNNPSDGSAGYAAFNQRYGFVHADKSPLPLNTLAHELGHATFGLTHTTPDVNNIMYNYVSPARTKFRKNQWDKMHP